MGFAVRILNESNSAMQPAPQLELRPRRWSDAEFGGPEQATVDVLGPLDVIHAPLQWLGYTVQIVSEYDNVLWWGYVDEVEVSFGGFTVRLALRDVYNRISVLYSYTDAAGANATGQTAWVSDTTSINRYGQRELLASLTDATAADAEAMRGLLLSQVAQPRPQISGGGRGISATLECRGYWSQLAWQYFESTEGQEEYPDVGQAWQELGAAYTASTIGFEPVDNIIDSADGFTFLEDGDAFWVYGSSLNNGVFTVGVMDGDGHINTSEDTTVLEVAGAAITVGLGRHYYVNKVGQSFQLGGDGGWTATSVGVRLQGVGSPSDNVVVQLCANSAGNPGTVLDTATLAAGDLTSQMTWTSIPFAGGAVVLATSTTYWLVVSRSGSADASNYVRVELNEALGYTRGALKFFNGSTWASRTPDADMPFRLVGAVDAAERIEDIVTDNSQFAGVDVRSTAGLERWQYRDGTNTGLAYILELLAPGTAAGVRLLTRVTPERIVVVEAAPASGDMNMLLGMDGRLRPALGGLMESGKLVAGRWVDLELPSTATRALAGLSPVFVQRSEFDGESGELRIETAGTRTVWELATPEMG